MIESYTPSPEIQKWLELADEELLQAWKDGELVGHTTAASAGRKNLHLYLVVESGRLFVKNIENLAVEELE